MRPFEPRVVAPPPPESALQAPPSESVVQVPPELPMLVVEFCLTAAFEIAIRSTQTPTTQYYSITFHLLCLVMVFAFAFIFVAKYISSKHPNLGRVLEHAGVVCGVTAFLVAITVSFPLCLKTIVTVSVRLLFMDIMFVAIVNVGLVVLKLGWIGFGTDWK
ncbi:unnamed protein product [Camellia sinensis]